MFSEFRKDCEKVLKEFNIDQKRLSIGQKGDLSVFVGDATLGEAKYGGLISKLERDGPYVNFYIDWDKFGKKIVKEVLHQKDKYGGHFEKGHCIIEHTSINPNASPHIGRSRNAIIGDTLSRMLKHSGMKTTVQYYVNDVGKQIAMLVAAAPENPTFHELLEVYVNANEMFEKDERFQKEVDDLRKKIDSKDKGALEKFSRIVDISVKGITSVFADLGIKYDEFVKESDYIGKMDPFIKKIEKLGKLVRDEKGMGVDLTGLMPGERPFLLLETSDGNSLYAMKDIPHEIEKSKRADRNIIVLGEDQKLYAEQIKATLKLLGHKPYENVHYSFVGLPEGKMSTRKGNVVLLEDFILDLKNEAFYEIKSRYNLDDETIEKRTLPIAASAMRYGMIKVGPEKSMIFDPKEAVSFEGDTGPYLQYAYARMSSILKKDDKDGDLVDLTEEEKSLLKKISLFEDTLRKALGEMKPNLMASYARELAVAFNRFYEKCPVLVDDSKTRESRISIVKSSRQALSNALYVLGIEPIEEM